MVKITKKINYDSLWVKAEFKDKSYIKAVINRRETKVIGTNVQHFKKFEGVFSELYRAGFVTLGEVIDKTADAWKRLE